LSSFTPPGESDIRYASFRRLIRTASFRLAAIYLALFSVSVVVLGAIVYFIVGREISRQIDDRVLRETSTLEAHFERVGLAALTQEIRARTLAAASLDYRLEDEDGGFIAGNLPTPAIGHDSFGFVSFQFVVRAASDEKTWERALITKLKSGPVLVVGEELTGVVEARRAVLIAFFWVLAATLVLGALGGLFLGSAFLQRIDAMSRTAQGIIEGDLSRRVPDTRGTDDDFARLARTFNKMLDRIGALLESNKHISDNIAHDLRSPLARVLRRLEAARANATAIDDYKIAIDAAVDEVNGILATFGALLRIGQIETGARRAGFRNVDLAAIASEVAEAFQPSATDEGKTLVAELQARLSMGGDKELLTQLVANLVDNAIRHTFAGCRINMNSSIDADGARLTIADDGPGVPASELSRIFERFHRVDRSRRTPGDGLGLSLVAAIAELHEMQIVASDNEPGLKISLVIRMQQPSSSSL
jgi:signal transduction histidine kinase